MPTANAVAIAASIALPPSCKIFSPTFTAAGSPTIAPWGEDECSSAANKAGADASAPASAALAVTARGSRRVSRLGLILFFQLRAFDTEITESGLRTQRISPCSQIGPLCSLWPKFGFGRPQNVPFTPNVHSDP